MEVATDALMAEETLNDKLFCRERLRVAAVEAHVVEALPQIAMILEKATVDQRAIGSTPTRPTI